MKQPIHIKDGNSAAFLVFAVLALTVASITAVIFQQTR